jgi:hypothetical protein
MVTNDISAAGSELVAPDLSLLFHRLNNQLGVILANAELLENRLSDEPHKLRAGQVVSSALDAIDTVRKLRQLADPAAI